MSDGIKITKDKFVPAEHYTLFLGKEFVGCVLLQNLNQYEFDAIRVNPKNYAEIKEKFNVSTSKV